VNRIIIIVAIGQMNQIYSEKLNILILNKNYGAFIPITLSVLCQ